MRDTIPMIRAAMLEGLDELLKSKYHVNLGVDELLDELGSTTKPPLDIQLNTYAKLLDRAAELTGDPCFGLNFASNFPLGRTHFFGFLIPNAPDLRTMVECISRYIRFQADAFEFIFDESQDGIATITWRFGPQVIRPHKTLMEFSMGLFADRVRRFVGSDCHPVVAKFDYPDPRATKQSHDKYEQMFGGNLTFDSPLSSLSSSSTALKAPLKGANPALFKFMLEYAEKELEKVEASTKISERVQSFLIETLPVEEVSLETASTELKMTPRQLQTQLRREGTNFETVLTEVRKGLAKRYLKNTDHSMTEIAMVLGFSEQSAFTRAIKTWFSMTPTELRADLRSRERRDDSAEK